jgi:hypothetical protein
MEGRLPARREIALYYTESRSEEVRSPLTEHVLVLPSVLLGDYCLRTCFSSVRWTRSAFSNWDMSERITRSPSFSPAKTSTVVTEARPSST